MYRRRKIDLLNWHARQRSEVQSIRFTLNELPVALQGRAATTIG
jgi:hypothetical protein